MDIGGLVSSKLGHVCELFSEKIAITCDKSKIYDLTLKKCLKRGEKTTSMVVNVRPTRKYRTI